MSNEDERIIAALEQSRVVRSPKQQLATFGVTNLRYFMVTEPVYQELTGGEAESVLREGMLISRQPEVVTPTYLMNVHGFGDEARRMFQMLASQFGGSSPGLMYSYRNESEKMDILSGDPDGVAERVKDDLDRKSENLAVVLRGPDELWDVALLKFIFEYTAASVSANVGELEERGMLRPDPFSGLPGAAVQSIETMFRRLESRQGGDPKELKEELDRWGVFDRYEDRFLGLFRRRYF